MTVLIVEDEPRARRGLKNIIQNVAKKSEIIGEVGNGKIALEMILAYAPEVVITDIRMPQMDGLSLLKAVRARGLNTKFVIISAYEEFDYAKQAISLGVVDYLVKPVMPDDVRKLFVKLETCHESNWTMEGGKMCDEYPDAHPLVKRALRIIEESYSTKLSQTDIANTLGITAEYFSYIFAKNIGQNFSKFIKTYRIKKAIEILEKDKTKKNEIADMTGFSDSKYFSKCFKEETGENVSEYIQNHIS